MCEERVDEIVAEILDATGYDAEKRDECMDRIEAACARGAVEAFIAGASSIVNGATHRDYLDLARTPGGSDGESDTPRLTAGARYMRRLA